MSVTPKSDPKPRPPPGVEIQTGTVLGGYRVHSELGRGGMGVVYRAEDLQRGGTVALKTLLWGDPAAMLRFKQEFRAIADITHPNLATLFELASEDERLFFTMELIEGVDFAEWVRADPSRLRPALAQLAQGLNALHAAGRIHRDLKPPNVRVARDGRVVILDFGLAATLGIDGAHQSTILAAKGTPAYMAPEQAQGKPVTAACDWYGVGVMLYEALTGHLPFEGAGLDVLLAKQTGTPRPVAEVASDVPEDLDALCTDLLQQEPERRPDGAEVLRRLQVDGPTVQPPPEAPAEAAPAMVGREAHLRALREAFDAQREGHPVVVLVHGYSGMGKTTLVQSFLEEVGRGSAAVVLQGKCYERESVPYKALDGPIDSLARYLGRLSRLEVEALLPRDVHSIARVFPVLRRVEAIAQALPPKIEISDPKEVRRRAFAGLRETFARISDRSPLVLCVDDLQWGDADSADLLASLLRPPEAPAFLFVGCYRREDAASPFLQSIREPGQGLPAAREIRVDPLSADEALTLAGSLLAEAGERAAALARESGGSPFFLRELATHDAGADAGGVTLEDVLRRRCAALPADAGALLEVVAVAGGPVPRATAAFAAQLKEGAPSSMMAALRSARLVRVTSSETDEELDTYHDRVRETVLADLAADHRRDLHRRLGHVLEADPDVDPEMLGTQFEGAGDAVRAGGHYARAAEEAHRALAFDHAAQLYRKTVDLLSPTGEKRRHLLRRLADALADGGRGGEAAPIYLDAAKGTTGVESLELRLLAAQTYLTSGHIDEWWTVIDPIRSELKIRLPRSSFRAALRVLREFLWIRLRGFGYRARDPETISKDAILRLEACYTLSNLLSQIDLLQGLQYHTLGVRLALKIGHPVHVAMKACSHFGYLNGLQKTASHREKRLQEVVERLAIEAGDPAARAWFDACVGATAFLRGNWTAARAPLYAAARRFREECVGYWWELNFSEFWWLMTTDLLGEFLELDAAGNRSLRDAEDRGNRYMETDLRTRIISVCALLRDTPGDAREGVDDAIDKWPVKAWTVQRYRWLDSRMSIALYRGDLADGRELLEQQCPGFERSFLTRVRKVNNVVIFGRDRLLLAEAAACHERGHALSSKVARLGHGLARAGEAYAEGWGLLLRAGVANVSGDSEAALRHLEAAEAKFVETEMAAYRAVTRRRRGQLIGGDEGRDLVAESDAWLEGQGVQDPVAWARMYAPGFEDQA